MRLLRGECLRTVRGLRRQRGLLLCLAVGELLGLGVGLRLRLLGRRRLLRLMLLLCC